MNIVPEHCEVTFEFRHLGLAAVDADSVVERYPPFARESCCPACGRCAVRPTSITIEPL